MHRRSSGTDMGDLVIRSSRRYLRCQPGLTSRLRMPDRALEFRVEPRARSGGQPMITPGRERVCESVAKARRPHRHSHKHGGHTQIAERASERPRRRQSTAAIEPESSDAGCRLPALTSCSGSVLAWSCSQSSRLSGPACTSDFAAGYGGPQFIFCVLRGSDDVSALSPPHPFSPRPIRG